MTAIHDLRPISGAEAVSVADARSKNVAAAPHLKYRPDIDGLRAIAVVSVVFFHAFPEAIPGGYVGVDIFFVISGCLISSILFAELAEGRFSIVAFYARRVRRIFPALACCLAAVLAYGFIALTPAELAQLSKHAFFGAASLANISFWLQTGYFDGAATTKPLLHLWSLGVEEQFYIVWPVLLWLAYRARLKISVLIAVLFALSFATNIALSRTNISDAFYLPMPRFWELLAGAALAIASPAIISPRARSVISGLGLLALIAALALLEPATRFPGWFALLPVLGASAIILAGPYAILNRALSHPALVKIGLISYPLYLWHWPLISYAYIIRLGKPPTLLMAAGLVVLSALLAWLTYRLIESPIRFGSRKNKLTWLAAGMLSGVGVAALVIWLFNGFPQRSPDIDLQEIAAAKADGSFKPTPGMVVTDRDWILTARLGEGSKSVIFAGDSLLFQYGPRVQELSDQGKLTAKTIFVTGPRCPPVPGVIQLDQFARCAKLPDVVAKLVLLEAIKVVVLGAAWSGYSEDWMSAERDGVTAKLNTALGQDLFYQNLEQYVKSLQAAGAKVYLILGQPINMRFDPDKMVKRSITGVSFPPDVEKPVSVSELRSTQNYSDSRLREVVDLTGGAELLNPFPDICGSSEQCSPFFENRRPKYTDFTHLRPTFVRDHIHFLDQILTAP
ncbi:peptidoglycan/LPS O-acetylase OafA/YrhL [Bradyrhizobium sp. USDA 4518]